MKHGRHLNFKKKRAIILIGFSCWQLSGFLTYIPYIHHLPTSLTDFIYQYHLQTSLTKITYCQLLTSPYSLIISYLNPKPQTLPPLDFQHSKSKVKVFEVLTLVFQHSKSTHFLLYHLIHISYNTSARLN